MFWKNYFKIPVKEDSILKKPVKEFILGVKFILDKFNENICGGVHFYKSCFIDKLSIHKVLIKTCGGGLN